MSNMSKVSGAERKIPGRFYEITDGVMNAGHIRFDPDGNLTDEERIQNAVDTANAENVPIVEVPEEMWPYNKGSVSVPTSVSVIREGDAARIGESLLPSGTPSDGEVLRYNGTEWKHLPDTEHGKLHKVVEGTVNAGHPDFTDPYDTTTRAGRASAIQDAIDHAEDNGDLPLVKAPDSFVSAGGWDASSVNYSGTGGTWTGRMVREGQQADVYDLKAYGAAGDGSQNDQAAFDAWLNAAKGDRAYVPIGTFVVDGFAGLDASWNGTEIFGAGFGSQLKMSGTSKSDRFDLFDLDDDNNALKNIEIHHLLLDGNKSNVTANGNTGTGLTTTENGNDDENIRIHDLWIRNCVNVGLNTNTKETYCEDIISWNNGTLGVGVDAVNGKARLRGIVAFDNGSHGIDLSSGDISLVGFISRDNGGAGMKTSTNAGEIEVLHGSLLNNDGAGFTMTGTVNLLEMDQVESRNNGRDGYRFANDGSRIEIGVIYSDNNNQTSGSGNVLCTNDITLIADVIITENSAKDGLITGGTNRIGYVEALNNGEDGIRHIGGSVDELYLAGGLTDGNAGRGFFDNGDPSVTVVRDLEVLDDFYLNPAGSAGRRIMRNVDVSSATSVTIGDRVLRNGVAREENSAEEPTAAHWNPYDMVEFKDTGDGSGNGVYMLLADGATWAKISSTVSL